MLAGASSFSSQVVVGGKNAAFKNFERIQNTLGEDYHYILSTNPLVLDTLEKSSLLVDNTELLSTVFNVPWSSAALWTAASGTAVTFQRPLGRALGGLFHYGPGHVKRWAEVNQYMDSVAGSGHRLKFGHSLGDLPDIYDQFGQDGIPAFFCHLIQDFTTVDGLPIFPDAWAVKQSLAASGLAPRTATALVSLSAANLLTGLMIATTVWKIWETWERNQRKRKLLSAASSAAANQDYGGAIETYKRVLEIERDSATLIALGQVYLTRISTRPFAHRAFTDAVQLLGSEPGRTIPYEGAQLSLRGVAGLQALATADVLGDRFPQAWQEQVEDLLNATIHSFSSAAAAFESASTNIVLNPLIRPPLFSAAINRFLAAQVACQYPLLEDRHRIVNTHLVAALQAIGRMAQSDETCFRLPVSQLRELWVRALLPLEEADLFLATT